MLPRKCVPRTLPSTQMGPLEGQDATCLGGLKTSHSRMGSRMWQNYIFSTEYTRGTPGAHQGYRGVPSGYSRGTNSDMGTDRLHTPGCRAEGEGSFERKRFTLLLILPYTSHQHTRAHTHKKDLKMVTIVRGRAGRTIVTHILVHTRAPTRYILLAASRRRGSFERKRFTRLVILY